jgi:transcriptional regulator with XRE-family HTH domain
MVESPDPAVQRLALRLQLRKIRMEAGLTQKQVAKSLDWSPSKLLRIESGEVSVSTTDLQALLTHYKYKDPRRSEEMVRMAQGSRKSIASTYDDVLSREVQLLRRYERAASIIRQFEPNFVPGLLQTREYAEVMHKLFASPEDSAKTIERRVEARLERQELLERDDLPEMFFILDETVVRRWVGVEEDDSLGPAVMRRQLEYLKKLGDNPRISIQILPFKAGAHQGMKGPFVILEFADPSVGELLYMEDVKGSYISREDPADTRPYLERFWDMESRATTRDELDAFLDDTLQDMVVRAGKSGEAATS